MSMFSSSSSKGNPHLHTTEYPGDDYSHIRGYGSENAELSKLQLISAYRIADTVRNKIPLDTDGCGIDRSFYISSEDLLEEIGKFDEQYGKPIEVTSRVITARYQKSNDGDNIYSMSMAIAAEFKRASPSKGDINMEVDVVAQTMKYANMGAAIISVLTEFQHFKGTLADMKKVRIATQYFFGDNRPGILRKDFIFDRYQILEARSHGADTVLLIVAVLGVAQLKDLIAFCRDPRVRMEPLVEVHTDREMEIALDCGAKFIGVNNRDLHTFHLDLGTTSRILKIAEKRGVTWQRSEDGTKEGDVCVAALSGISCADDMAEFSRLGISCCLIGETLMKSTDPAATLSKLLQRPINTNKAMITLVKTCGMTQESDVRLSLQSGTRLMGIIFAGKSPRAVKTLDQAIALVNAVRAYGERTQALDVWAELANLSYVPSNTNGVVAWYREAAEILQRLTVRTPLSVGVFQNQPIEEVNKWIEDAGLDLVQLHGDEDESFMQRVSVPCIKVLHMAAGKTSDRTETVQLLQEAAAAFAGRAVALLLDSKLPGTAGGGTGQVFDWTIATDLYTQTSGLSVMLAGGLTAENVESAKDTVGVIGVDVSSGIEIRPGEKDEHKMDLFIKNALKAK